MPEDRGVKDSAKFQFGDEIPMTELQKEQARKLIERIEHDAHWSWDKFQVGLEDTWEDRITQGDVFGLADSVQDYNPWYGNSWLAPVDSPFGGPIAPPLLLITSRWANLHIRLFGAPKGLVHASHDTHFFAPVRVGTLVRFHSKLTKKFIKRDRRYIEIRTECTNAETGELLLTDRKEMLVSGGKKVSEPKESKS